jgi:hypothetical protein
MLVIEREHIDMVVISTHGISGWRPMVFGSIAEQVVKRVECPLLAAVLGHARDKLKSALRLCFRRIGHTAWGQCIGHVKTRNSDPTVGHPVIDVEAVR